MSKITQKLGRFVQSLFVAPNATYVKFNPEHHCLATPLKLEAIAANKLVTQIDRDMHYGEKQISPMWPWGSARVTRIEQFVSDALNSCNPGFECRFDENGRIAELTESPLGHFYYDRSILMGKLIDEGLGLTLDPYRLRPKMRLYFDVYERHALGKFGAQYFAAHPANRTPNGGQFLWESFNELISMIRAEAEARGLKTQEIAHTYRSTRTFKGMMKVVNQCFTKRRRIFVICMDLFFHSDWAGKVSLGRSKELHAEFVNRLRALAKIKKGLIGAIWKLEWAESRGDYFRWVFMFDGDAVQATWEYGEFIDDLWKDIVPESAGETFVLNDEEHIAADTGMIDLDEDPEKFEIFVDSVIRYLAHKDQLLSIKREPGTRTWDSLTMPGD